VGIRAHLNDSTDEAFLTPPFQRLFTHSLVLYCAAPVRAFRRELRPVGSSAREGTALIRKLRGMKLEDEACRLQSAVCRLPPEERGTVSAGPFSTD
jgi:hypothetical protein